MDINLNITELKTNPSKAISMASDYPVAIVNRNNVKAYIIGKELFDELSNHLEDSFDGEAIRNTDFSKGRDFEEVAKELGI